MNAKTAKLINKFCLFNSLNSRVIKRRWYSTPHNKKNAFREEMRQYLTDEIKVELNGPLKPVELNPDVLDTPIQS